MEPVKRNQHVTFRPGENDDGVWVVRIEGPRKLSPIGVEFDEELDAIRYARGRAIRDYASVVIWGRDGRIRHIDDYKPPLTVDQLLPR